MDLLEKIDELRAQSVTPDRFKDVFGISIEAHMQELLTFINEQKAKDASAKTVK